MKLRIAFATTSIMAAIMIVWCMWSYGEGEIGASYNQVVDDVSYGITGNYERDFELGELEASSQVQAGDKYLADAHLSFTFDIGSVGFRPYIDAIGKAETFDDIGGKLDYGVTLNVPLHDTTEVGIGIFLRNANPFASKTLYELVDNEYISVGSNPGINYDNPAKVNVLAYTGFEFKRFDIGLKSSIGVGERDYWLIADASTGWDFEYLTLNLGVNIGNRWYVDNGGEETSKADIAIISTVSRQW